MLTTPFPAVLPALFLFPSSIPLDEPAPQQFALQFWDAQKHSNTSQVIAIIGLLHSPTHERLLVEVALASNAPTALKTQALLLLPPALSERLRLSDIMLTPYMPVPETNGEEWDRLETASALDVVVELVLGGEYNGILGTGTGLEGLELRAAASSVFENFVRKDEIREAIVHAMLPSALPPSLLSDPSAQIQAPPTPLLLALSTAESELEHEEAAATTHFATLLFAHLLRGAPRCKVVARDIIAPNANVQPVGSAGPGGGFFVPADNFGAPPPTVAAAATDDEEEETQTLLQLLTEHLSLALLSHARASHSHPQRDRVIIGYLTLLSQWLWDEPGSVREFLNGGGLGVVSCIPALACAVVS